MTELQIRYKELTKEDITPQLVWDLNALLPQLSMSAPLVTEKWIVDVLESGTRMFGAFDGKRLVAVTSLVRMLIPMGLKAWIEDVVTDVKYRKRGISSTLMRMAEAASREAGATSINLTSKPERVEAHALYERLGYQRRETVVFRNNL